MLGTESLTTPRHHITLRHSAIVDRLPTTAFDRLTRLTARMFNVPLAMINLVGDEQWWTTSRSDGVMPGRLDSIPPLCADTTTSKALHVVPDIHAVSQFMDDSQNNHARGMRFYAGAPLHAADGACIGTLCMFDESPRELDPEQRAMLEDLAGLVVDQVELAIARTVQQTNDESPDQPQIAPVAPNMEYRLVALTHTDGIITFDSRSRIHYTNTVLADTFGYASDELHGQSWTILVSERIRERLVEHMQHYLATGAQTLSCDDLELVGRHRNGSDIPLEMTLMTFVEGGERFFTGIVRDATLRVQAERRLRQLHEIISAPKRSFDQKLSDVFAAGCREFGLENAILTRLESEQFEVTHALSPNPVLQPGLIVARELVYCDVAVRSVEPVAFECARDTYWQQHPGYELLKLEAYLGTTVMIDEHVYGTLTFSSRQPRNTPFTLADKDYLRLMAQWVSSEIERQQTARQLELQRDFAQEIVTTMGQGLTITDEDGRFEYVNPAYANMLGYKPEQLLGKSPWELTPSEYHFQLVQAQQARRSGTITSYETRLRHTDGSHKYVFITGAPRMINGKPKGSIAVTTDLTERRWAEEALRTSEERFRLLVEGVRDYAIIMLDPQGHIISWNSGAERIKGYRADDIIGRHFRCLYPPDEQHQNTADANLHIAEQNGRFETEDWRARRDGSLYWASVIITALHNDQGQLRGFAKVTRDLTQHKQAAEKLRAMQARLQHLLSFSPAVIYSARFSDDYGATFISDNVQQMLGYEPQEFVSNSAFWAEHIHPDDVSHVFREYERLHELGAHTCEYRFLHKNGTYRWMHDTFRLVYNPAGEPLEIVGSWLDMTNRKEAEESRNRLVSILEATPDIVVIADADRQIRYINRSGRNILGDTPDLTHRAMSQLYAVAMHEHLDKEIVPTALSHGTWSGITNLVRSDGRELPVSQVVIAHKHANDTIQFFSIIARDITERITAERALEQAYGQLSSLNEQLRRSRDLLRMLFDRLDDGLLLLDHEGRVLAINQTLARLINKPPQFLVEQMWETVCATYNPDFPVNLVRQTLYDGRARKRRRSYTTLEGQQLVLDVQAIPLLNANQRIEHLIIHAEDITERLQLEALAIQNERLSTGSKIAATVAHEINTPLQSIRNCLYLAERASDSSRSSYLSLAREEIDRISEILRGLLDLHRPGNGTVTPIDLNGLIERVILLTRGTLNNKGVTLITECQHELPFLMGNADQLTQVLLNLILNAADSISEAGTITIATRTDFRDRQDAEETINPVIVLTVTDTGTGIPPATLPQIFQPFYTTKLEGSGLGLAISQKIVEYHGGTITVQSELGQGTTFTIHFPLKQKSGATDEEIDV